MNFLRNLFLVFFILVTPVYGAELLSYPPNTIMGFRGLDTRSTAPLIADGRASDLLNVDLSLAFDLRKRYGYSVINDTLDDLDIDSPAITGIFDTLFSDATSHTIAFVGSKVKYDNSGTWTTIAGTATITTGQNNQFQCIMALDSAICTNDVDVPLKINSTPTKSVLDVSDLTDTLTKVRTTVWFRNYLILGNTVEDATERPTRFRWSNVGTIETYTDDDFVDISTFAGDEIIGFTELYGDLYIFLTNSIWKASLVGGDDIFVFTKVIDGIGAISTHTIKIVYLSDNRTAIIFTDDNKRVLLFNGAVITDIGRIIQPSLDATNESRLGNTVATFDGNRYILSISSSGITTNDLTFLYYTNINEWSKFSQIDANAFAQVKETDGKIKTYFGNYESFVYWLDDTDQTNDVDGATGIVDEMGTIDTTTGTGLSALIDATLATGTYTGAVARITSGTGVGSEAIVITNLPGGTGLVLASPFSTTPDSTSVYSVGDIEASYTTKWYDFGDSAREKTMLGMLLWGEEASNNEIDISYSIDFGSQLGSEALSLSPSGSSLWDEALWDVGTWGSSGNKIYTSKFNGFGNFLEIKIENSNIDETFHLYGFNMLSVSGDIKQ